MQISEINLPSIKLLRSILSLSLVYNFVYHLSIIDFDKIFSYDFDIELIKIILSNFLINYSVAFLLFFGAAIHRLLLYIFTIFIFTTMMLSSQYFTYFYDHTTLVNILEMPNLYCIIIILIFLFSGYLVYYTGLPNILMPIKMQILMCCCIILSLYLLIFFDANEKDKDYFVTVLISQLSIIHKFNNPLK